MAVLTNYEGSNDDYENGGTGGGRGQSFKLPSDSSVSSISIYGSRGNAASGTTRFSIHSSSMTGTELVGKTITTSTLSSYGSAAWNEIVFDSPVNLTGGVTYYLKALSLTGSSNDELRWSTDYTSPSYSDGGSWYATSGDTGWTDYSGSRDKNFRINGTVGGGGGGTYLPKIIQS